MISNKFWEKIITVTLALIGSGLFAAWVNSIYSDRIAKREITVKVIEIIADNLFKSAEMSIEIDNASPKQLSELLTRKEQAFLIRKLTDFLISNYPNIDFKDILPAINEIETRFSYARLYQAGKKADILFENLYFVENQKKKIVLNSALGKGYKENIKFLDEVTIELVSIDIKNQSFRVKIENDIGNTLCYQTSRAKNDCEFNVDLTDTLENLPYEHMLITENIRYINPSEKSGKIVMFSILKRMNEDSQDKTYWHYKLKKTDMENEDETCENFFDHKKETISKPPPPSLANFDRGVLRACGPIDGSVTTSEFKQLIFDNFNQVIQGFNPPPNPWKTKTKVQIINELHRIWTFYDGFNHIFCGNWDRGSIGGLHDRSRYLQLQNENKACYFKSPLEDILSGYIYTIGVRSEDNQNIHEIKGYSLNKSSIELFSFATQVFYKFCNKKNGWRRVSENVYKSNLYEKDIYIETNEKGKNITYRVLFYATDKNNPLTYGIKTIYPDLTPPKVKKLSLR